MLADKAYSSRANRAYLRDRKIAVTIPVKVEQQAHRRRRGSAGARPPVFDEQLYRQRHAVECSINLLTQHRALATRYDKLALRHEATMHIATINIWLCALAAQGFSTRLRRSPAASGPGRAAPAFQYLSILELDDRVETMSARTFVDTPMWTGSPPSSPGTPISARGAGVAPTWPPTPRPPGPRTCRAFRPPTSRSWRSTGCGTRDRLRAPAAGGGVPVELHLFPGTFHGSGLLPAAVSRREARERVAVLVRALSLTGPGDPPVG